MNSANHSDELDRAPMALCPVCLTSQPPAIPPAKAKVLRRLRHRIAGLDAMADQLRANADAFEETEIEETLEALLAVADELRTMLPD